jgi:hypothetical protein
MKVLPAFTPSTSPVVGFTDAIAVLLLLHEPKPSVFVNTVVASWHTELAPLIAAGGVFTVTAVSAIQPDDTV